MPHRIWTFCACALGAVTITACTGQTQSTTTAASAAPSESPSMAPVSAAPSAEPTAVATSAQTTAAPATMAQASPSPAGSATPTVTVAFTDIKGIFAEQAIYDLAKLGVFESTSGAFRPSAPIKRREFIRWLVRANNAIFSDTPDKQVRLAESGDATFVDVPPSDPDFKYIQGMANAGYVIGYDAKHFRPEQNLVREELVAIKAPFDHNGAQVDQHAGISDVRAAWGFSDIDQISKQYYASFYTDYFVSPQHNISRIWGTIKKFQPLKPVTRAEAALAADVISQRKAPGPTP